MLHFFSITLCLYVYNHFYCVKIAKSMLSPRTNKKEERRPPIEGTLNSSSKVMKFELCHTCAPQFLLLLCSKFSAAVMLQIFFLNHLSKTSSFFNENFLILHNIWEKEIVIQYKTLFENDNLRFSTKFWICCKMIISWLHVTIFDFTLILPNFYILTPPLPPQLTKMLCSLSLTTFLSLAWLLACNKSHNHHM